MTQIVAVDIDAYDPAVPGVRTLRFATQSFVTPPQRTNYCLQSENLGDALWANGLCSAASAPEMWSGDDNNAPSPFWAIAKTTTGGSEARYQQLGMTITANMAVTETFAVLAGSVTTGSIGIYSTGDTWGIDADSSASVLSGPGTLSRYAGGLFNVNNLSATVPTLVAVTRILRSTAAIRLYIYPGGLGSLTIGHSIKATRFMLEAGSTWGQYLKTLGSTVTYPASAADANLFYEGRIKQPANIQRTCFDRGQTFGQSRISFGDLVLVNNDGELDPLLNYGFAGRNITIKLGTITPASKGIPTWVNVIKGRVEQAQLSWQEVTIRVRDAQLDLAQPIQQVRYAGSNSLPNGLEGVPGDLNGRCKPLVFGQVFNVSMPCVNTTRLIYQLHHGSALQSVDGVYDRGAPLTAGSTYTSQSDMEANAPSAGQYRVWNSAAGTYIRLGTNSSGAVTADATQGANAAARTVGQLFNSILTYAGIASGNISAADITALDAAASYATGLATPWDRDMTTLEALDILCASVGAWYGADRDGVFRIGRIEIPQSPWLGSFATEAAARAGAVSNYNLLSNTNIADASWSKSVAGVALAPVVTIGATDPLGGNGAFQVVFDLNGGTALGDISQLNAPAYTISAGVYYSGGFTMKTADGSTKTFSLVNPDGNVVQSITVNGSWSKPKCTSFNSVSFSGNLRLRLRGAGEGTSSSATVILYAPQFVAGMTLPPSVPEFAIQGSVFQNTTSGLPNRLGLYSGVTVLAAQSVVGIITAADILSIERVPSADAGAGIPAWKVKVNYKRLWYTQDNLTANVTADRKAFLSDENRRVERSDSTVKVIQPMSPEMSFDTVLLNETDAGAEADRRLLMYRTRRDTFQVTVRVDATLAAALDLGKIITLQINRYGMGSGKNLIITGIRTNMRGYLYDLTLWG